MHHQPRTAPAHLEQQAAIIYLANCICNAKQQGYVVAQQTTRDDLQFAMDALHFRKEDISVIVDELDNEVSRARELFFINECR